MKLTAAELKTKLELHLKWLKGEEGGERANLQGANLQGAKLQRANLQGAKLQWAKLQWANLQRANLQRANLWVACWPLWCGTKKVKIDLKIAMQLAAHFCAVECDEP